jgi:hypothetical protein
MMLLLRAELASLDYRDSKKVQRSYDDAIAAAGKLWFMHHQALGNERAGVYFLKRNDRA